MKVKSLQMGGTVPDGQGQDQGQAGAEQQIAQMAQQIVQQLGPEASALLAQAIMQLVQGAAGGGGGGQEAPTYQKKGGKLVKVTKK